MKLNHFLWLSFLCFSQAQAFKLPDQEISSYECGKTCDELSHEPMHLEWNIHDQNFKHPLRNLQKSYGYKKKVTLEELRKGVVVNTLAPRAIIRISPISGSHVPILRLETKSHSLSFQEASSLYSRDEAFADADYDQNHHTVLQLKEELGAGQFKLVTDEQSISTDETFVISVFDKYSNAYLTVETNKDEYKLNDKIIATITLNDTLDYPVKDVFASIVAPNGDSIPLNLTKTKSNQYKGSAQLHSKKNDFGANWYVEAAISAWFGDQLITRQGHAAFSYSIPSAKLIEIEKVSTQPLNFKAMVNVANNSRYALQSVLYYKDSQGKFHPLSTSQTANWFTSGKHALEFTFDKNIYKQYDQQSLYLGYFHLVDYGQLKTVYHYDEPVKLSELG
ncbi:DUF4785 domain-containing protein [Legionella israelensis]|uniref:DUF4785 family protein n=1 Tax=Legionella israelensis TaxID=454 RepID=A0A0W0WMU8_9GAMM|nr:DUF4785 domain-containing protein [Legionella israelensis]KTD33615.1 hypothetical protein Lisr_0323 [Legionella israelensis]QBS08803.1 DUF4785 family protein [Legionella israelensis]SCY12700.1 protein of unknown function [Legionella israelensis DSM 19235]STX58481.1 Uncharacterised protein [Legionella israelensis]